MSAPISPPPARKLDAILNCVDFEPSNCAPPDPYSPPITRVDFQGRYLAHPFHFRNANINAERRPGSIGTAGQSEYFAPRITSIPETEILLPAMRRGGKEPG
jgi:hypothetical protein